MTAWPAPGPCCTPGSASQIGDKESYRDSVLEMLLSSVRNVEARQTEQHAQLVAMLDVVAKSAADSECSPKAQQRTEFDEDLAAGAASFGGRIPPRRVPNVLVDPAASCPETSWKAADEGFNQKASLGSHKAASAESEDNDHTLTVGGVVIVGSHYESIVVEGSSTYKKPPPIRDGVKSWLAAISFNCIHAPRFDYYIGMVIIANSFVIGYETALDAEGKQIPDVIDWAEHIFMMIYIAELAMRFFCDGWSNFNKRWVVFDMLMVGLGALSFWVLRPASNYAEENFYEGKDSEWLTTVETFMIARILRLLRLLRALRGLKQFRTLYTLAQGLLNSLGTMLSTLGLMLFTIFAFACVGCEFITNNQSLLNSDNEEVQIILSSNFSSLQEIMLTLTQFIFADSIGSIYVPLIKERWSLCLYFLPILLILPISMMNLVTAVLVDSARAMSEDDDEFQTRSRQKMIRRLVPEIQTAFRMADTDGNGVLTRSEVRLAASSLPAHVKGIISQESPLEFFETIDVDGSRLVEEEEFVEGILHMAINDISLETQQTLKILRSLKQQMKSIEEGLVSVHSNQHFRERKLSTLDFHPTMSQQPTLPQEEA